MTRGRKLLYFNVALLVASVVVWVLAWVLGWLSSVEFVSHVSMAALVFTAISGIAAGDAAVESEASSAAPD